MSLLNQNKPQVSEEKLLTEYHEIFSIEDDGQGEPDIIRNLKLVLL